MGISTTGETIVSPNKTVTHGIASKRIRVMFSWLLLINIIFLAVDLWAWQTGSSALHIHTDKIAVDIARVFGVAAWLPRRIWQTFALLGLAIVVFGLSFYV